MSVRVDDTNSRLSTLRAMNRQKGFQGNSLTADIVTCGSKLEQVGDGIRTLIDYLLELQNKYRSSSRQLCAEDEVDKFVKFLDYIAEDRLPLLMENRNAMSTIDAEQLGLGTIYVQFVIELDFRFRLYLSRIPDNTNCKPHSSSRLLLQSP